MTPQFKALNAALLGSVLAFSSAAYAQDIKVGFNGDLSASPSAQSGQAAVLGIRAAIEDVNAAGGVLGGTSPWWSATTFRSHPSRSRT